MWDTVGNDITKSVLAFFESGNLPKSINTTWVSLIPKVKGASCLLEYRPISMVGSIHKVILKVMASRLRNVLPDLVGESQTACVAGRQILDGALSKQQSHQLGQTKQKGGCPVKALLLEGL